MIFIVTALHCEAAPLIERFRLKRDMDAAPFETFRGDGMALTVSGIGKLRSAVATSLLFCAEECLPGRKVIAPAQKSRALNIGLCGAPPSIPPGSLLWVNKIEDASSRRRYYPDTVIKHGLPEAQLTTHDLPHYPERPADERSLADMEASGFAEATSAFLTWDAIACLKVVSDNLERTSLSPDAARELVESRIADIERVALLLRDHSSISSGALEEEHLALLAEIGRGLALTNSQRRILEEWSIARVAGSASLEVLRPFAACRPKEKRERNEIFGKIKDVLAST